MSLDLDEIISKFKSAKHNFELAQAAFDHTLQIIEGSSNQLSPAELESKQGQGIIERINKMREHDVSDELYSLNWILDVSRLAEKYRVGNCSEKSCVVFNFLYQGIMKKHEFSLNIELFNNPIVDHFVVVIGRDPSTKSMDPKKWNKDTIICDPWIEKRSYFIGEVDFDNLQQDKWYAIKYLLPSEHSLGPIQLKTDVLSKANQIRGRIIHSQDQMVLRSRFYQNELSRFNLSVPMFYEAWDRPKEKHYKKQLALDTVEDSYSYLSTLFSQPEMNSTSTCTARVLIP